jgi:hypothetical protein
LSEIEVHYTEIGNPCGKGIRADLWVSSRKTSQKTGFSGVGFSYKSYIGDQPKFDEELSFSSRFAILSKSRSLPARGGKVHVAFAAAAALKKYDLFVVVDRFKENLP